MPNGEIPNGGAGMRGGTDMFSDMFSGMVSEGILTQEQADKIQESMPQMGQGMPPGGSGGNENTQ